MISDHHMAEVVLTHKLISPKRLEEARSYQKRHGGDLYHVLIENGFVEEEPAITMVAQFLNIPCVSLRDFQADQTLINLLDPQLAGLHRAIPLGVEDNTVEAQIFLAMVNPIDVDALEELANATGREVVAFLAGPQDIAQTLERLYGRSVYKVRASLDELFGGDHTASDHSLSFGPSVSQLLEMPILPRDEDHDHMRLESLQHLHDDFVDPIASEVLPLEVLTTSLKEEVLSHGISVDDFLNDDELDLLLDDEGEGFLGDTFSFVDTKQKEEIFSMSASKIFMLPGSLTNLGQKRSPRSASIMSDEDHSLSMPQFQIPREFTKRAVRVLSMVKPREQFELPPPVLEQTREVDLLRALVHVLIKKELISEKDLHEAMREVTSPERQK